MTEPDFTIDSTLIDCMIQNGFDRSTKLIFELATPPQSKIIKVFVIVDRTIFPLVDWRYNLPQEEAEFLEDAELVQKRVTEFNMSPEYYWSLMLETPLRNYRDKTAKEIQRLEEKHTQSHYMLHDIYENFPRVQEERRS